MKILILIVGVALLGAGLFFTAHRVSNVNHKALMEVVDAS